MNFIELIDNFASLILESNTINGKITGSQQPPIKEPKVVAPSVSVLVTIMRLLQILLSVIVMLQPSLKCTFL